MATFDGPSQILFAGFVFHLLKARNIQCVNILAITIAISLICVLLEAKFMVKGGHVEQWINAIVWTLDRPDKVK
jgi:hypothetical protein